VSHSGSSGMMVVRDIAIIGDGEITGSKHEFGLVSKFGLVS